MKRTMLLTLVSLLILSCSTTFAAKAIQGNKEVLAVASNTINCNLHTTDVCVANFSNQTVYYNVPLLQQSGPLNPLNGVDVFSNAYFSNLGVTVKNAFGQIIFNQVVPDHSIIRVVNNNKGFATSKNSKHSKLKVTVKSGS